MGEKLHPSLLVIFGLFLAGSVLFVFPGCENRGTIPPQNQQQATLPATAAEEKTASEPTIDTPEGLFKLGYRYSVEYVSFKTESAEQANENPADIDNLTWETYYVYSYQFQKNSPILILAEGYVQDKEKFSEKKILKIGKWTEEETEEGVIATNVPPKKYTCRGYYKIKRLVIEE
jgi:hypothetical protein